MPTPEELARINIDKQLTACGWTIQDMAELNRYASLGVAVREFPLETGEADYLLFVDGKAVGVIEAKPEGLVISTTDSHLPRRIGEALKHAYHGELELHYDQDEDFVRVTWAR